MNPYVIIGGGLSGLLTARILKEKNIPFLGFEKTSRLGGRAEFGPHRLLHSESVALLEQLAPSVSWQGFDLQPKERSKGEYGEVREGFSSAEQFYLTSQVFTPTVAFEQFIEKVSEPITGFFKTQKTVTRILSKEKQIEFLDGSTQAYEKLIWCADRNLLFKVWEGEPLHSGKANKKANEKPTGFNWSLELQEPFFDTQNTVLMPFRFKEHKLRALGISDLNEEGKRHRLHWMVFVPQSISEDKEEVAKCVRTVKREVLKEFPELSSKISKEKLVYLPLFSGEEPALLKSLELAKDVYCVGPQVNLNETQSDWRNLDLICSQISALPAELGL